uniref:BTB domain-containing protein n=1 Tax=Panagrolaimus davidi TaxID=227884 RepID=A0A914QFB8_9BILA
MEISEITENIQFECVEIKNEKSTYSVDPTKPITVVISSCDPKIVFLRVLWKFIEIDIPDKMKRSIKSYNSYPTVEKELFEFCQRLTIQKNGNIFIKLKDGLGFIFYWEKSGKASFKGKMSYQMYNLKVSEMYNDIKLKYQKSIYTMSSGEVTTVEMSETSRLVELNVLWNYKNGYSEENTKCSLISGIKSLTKKLHDEMDPIDLNLDEINLVENEHTVNELYEKPVSQSTQLSPSSSIQEATIPENKEEKVAENAEINFSLSSPLNAAFESKKYADVIFLTNDFKKVFAHRCILFSFSEIFMAFFDQSSEIPIEIDVDFSETIVNRAIQFCYGKIDGIKNYENDLIKFADKYGIKGLKKSCLHSLKDQNLTTENVCETVKTAFEQNYTLLKQKCLKFIFQKKGEFGSEKLSKLPNEILVSTILCL